MKAGPLLLLAVLAGAACGSEGPVLVRLDMPGVSPFRPGDFDEIIVTEFRSEAPLPDLDPGPELRTYLAAEIRRVFPGKVALLPRPAGDDPAAWQEAAAGHERAVFVTGAVRLESQIRKAVEDKPWSDDPFRIAKRTLIEQLRWTLVVDLEVVSAATGVPLFRKTYTENRDYIELDKPADFAFSDLAYVFREHLFPTLLGTTTIESRALLRR